jgi:hypothetical protein
MIKFHSLHSPLPAAFLGSMKFLKFSTRKSNSFDVEELSRASRKLSDILQHKTFKAASVASLNFKLSSFLLKSTNGKASLLSGCPKSSHLQEKLFPLHLKGESGAALRRKISVRNFEQDNRNEKFTVLENLPREFSLL